MICRTLGLALAAALLSQPACAAVVHTWSGATENACRDRCPQDWAEAQLTKDELAQLRAEQKIHPKAYRIEVRDGDVFDLMTYFKEGKAQAYRTTTIARLDSPERAEGWDMGDWSFVKLEACKNWAILRKLNIGAAGLSFGTDSLVPVQTMPALFAAAFIPSASGGASGGGSSWTHGGGTDWPSPITPTPSDCTTCTPIPPCPPISAVPLPASALLLLTALAGLFLLKRRTA